LLAEPEQGVDECRSAVDAAEDFLRQLLADGLTPSSAVKTEATIAGVSWASVRRAADELGVKKQKGADCWYWSLPKMPKTAQGAQLPDVEHVEQVASEREEIL
jgi:hypothetical protein